MFLSYVVYKRGKKIIIHQEQTGKRKSVLSLLQNLTASKLISQQQCLSLTPSLDRLDTTAEEVKEEDGWHRTPRILALYQMLPQLCVQIRGFQLQTLNLPF